MDFSEMTMDELEKLRSEWTSQIEWRRSQLRLLVPEISRRAAIADAEKKVAQMSDSQKDAMRQVVQVAGIASTTKIGSPKQSWWQKILG